MKALSLTQPWATLVATRSWSTPYRGELLIHAAKNYPRGCRALVASDPLFRDALHPVRDRELPLGAVVACARLAFVVSTDAMTLDRRWKLTETERAFGDYSPARYAWLLDDVRPLAQPVACRGALGLWVVPPEVERAVRAQLAAV